MLKRLVKFFIGFALLPTCAALSLSLWVFFTLFYEENGLRSLSSFGIGFGLWVILYLALPRPARSYVLAHELSHAIWASLCGQSVHEIKVGKDSGHVLLSDTNFVITLAPYFFPFYSLCSVFLFWLFSLAWDQSPWLPFWGGLLGLTWAYHLTFTFSAIKGGQDDISENGVLFSFAIIYIGNLLGLLLWFGYATQPGWAEGWSQIVADHETVWQYFIDLFEQVFPTG